MPSITDIKLLISQIANISHEELDSNGSFKDIKNWDSIAVLRLLTLIENSYNIKLSLAKFLKINTPMELYQFVKDSHNV